MYPFVLRLLSYGPGFPLRFCISAFADFQKLCEFGSANCKSANNKNEPALELQILKLTHLRNLTNYVSPQNFADLRNLFADRSPLRNGYYVNHRHTRNSRQNDHCVHTLGNCQNVTLDKMDIADFIDIVY